LKSVSHLCPGQSGLQSSYLFFLHNWNDRYGSPRLRFIGWDGNLMNFFAQSVPYLWSFLSLLPE
jgi:hypothetical protein